MEKLTEDHLRNALFLALVGVPGPYSVITKDELKNYLKSLGYSQYLGCIEAPVIYGRDEQNKPYSFKQDICFFKEGEPLMESSNAEIISIEESELNGACHKTQVTEISEDSQNIFSGKPSLIIEVKNNDPITHSTLAYLQKAQLIKQCNEQVKYAFLIFKQAKELDKRHERLIGFVHKLVGNSPIFDFVIHCRYAYKNGKIHFDIEEGAMLFKQGTQSEFIDLLPPSQSLPIAIN